MCEAAEREEILVEGGGGNLPPEEVRARCETRVRALIAEACRWRVQDHGRTWTPGDYRILIFETTVALDAQLYVQFWSEPREAVAWEVSSGHANPAAQPFIKPEAHETLEGLGFQIGGGARNFATTVTIANLGDVHAVARQTLRIFCDALGYRGRTPLVARLTTSSRAEQAVVHHSFTLEDIQKILWRQGRRAQKVEGCGLPTISVAHDGTRYEVVLYGQVDGQNLYECIDLRVLLGTAGHTQLDAVNAINAEHRQVKVFVERGGNAWLVQAISTTGGITEDAFVVLVGQFECALADKGIVRLARQLTRAQPAEHSEHGEGKDKRRGTEAVH